MYRYQKRGNTRKLPKNRATVQRTRKCRGTLDDMYVIATNRISMNVLKIMTATCQSMYSASGNGEGFTPIGSLCL
jgi:hypothetical protein